MAVPFLDLAADWRQVCGGANERINEVLGSQCYVLGSQTLEFESRMRRRLGCKWAWAVSSGSDALYLALLALGIGRGDAVLVPSFSFFASAGAVVRAGAVPVFVDLDPSSFNAEAGQFEDALGRLRRDMGDRIRPAALMAVHLYGRAVRMQPLVRLAKSSGLALIEDAAQAVAASSDGRALGSWGDVGCFSFYPTKNLGAAGDGGLVVTGDKEIGERLERLRTHGSTASVYEHVEVGINARMAELQAAVLNSKLDYLDEWTARRRELAARYVNALSGTGGVVLPSIPPESEHVWHQFAVRILSDRTAVARAMKDKGQDSRVFYPIALHQQPCFADLLNVDGLAQSERAAKEVLCLPIYPSLSDEGVDDVVACLSAALAAALGTGSSGSGGGAGSGA